MVFCSNQDKRSPTTNFHHDVFDVQAPTFKYPPTNSKLQQMRIGIQQIGNQQIQIDSQSNRRPTKQAIPIGIQQVKLRSNKVQSMFNKFQTDTKK